MDIRILSLLYQLLGLVAAKSSFSGNFNHFEAQIMLRPFSTYMEQPIFPWLFLCVFTWLNLFETLMISYLTHHTKLQFHYFPSREVFSILCEIENVICLSTFLFVNWFTRFISGVNKQLACASHCISGECIFRFCLANYQMWCWSS